MCIPPRPRVKNHHGLITAQRSYCLSCFEEVWKHNLPRAHTTVRAITGERCVPSTAATCARGSSKRRVNNNYAPRPLWEAAGGMAGMRRNDARARSVARPRWQGCAAASACGQRGTSILHEVVRRTQYAPLPPPRPAKTGIGRIGHPRRWENGYPSARAGVGYESSRRVTAERRRRYATETRRMYENRSRCPAAVLSRVRRTRANSPSRVYTYYNVQLLSSLLLLLCVVVVLVVAVT